MSVRVPAQRGPGQRGGRPRLVLRPRLLDRVRSAVRALAQDWRRSARVGR